MNADPKKLETWGIIGFGVLVVATIIAQVVSAASDKPPGALVTALFNVLQFVFSLLFGWILTRVVTREEFEESRRNFAISAYRRILDISSSFDNLKYKLAEKAQLSGVARAEFESVSAMTFAIEQTIASSIADWTDIIGEEIETVNAMQRLKNERDEAVARAALLDSTATELQHLKSITASYEQQISTLKMELPRSLRQAPLYNDTELEVLRYASRLRSKLRRGGLYLEGFWDSAFERDAHAVESGTPVELRLAAIPGRVPVWVAYSEDGHTIGQLINPATSDYDQVFTPALMSVLGEKFTALMTERNRIVIPDGNTTRHYFAITVFRTATLPGERQAGPAIS